MVLDIPPHIEQVLTVKAQAQGLSIIDMLDKDYAGEPSQSLKLGTRIAQRFEAIADDDFSIPSRDDLSRGF